MSCVLLLTVCVVLHPTLLLCYQNYRQGYCWTELLNASLKNTLMHSFLSVKGTYSYVVQTNGMWCVASALAINLA